MSDSWNFDYPKIARESGFHFQQYNDGIFDWRLIGSIEVERILHNQNIEKLDNVIQHLSEAPLGALLQNQILESGVAKYFILSQLAIQYLLFCKKFLDETLTSVRDSLQEIQSENIRLTKLQQDNSNELLQLHKELQQMKAISEIVYPCSMCTKNFISNEMLKVHFARKHTTEISSDKKSSDKENDRNLISTIKLELEIKHLKERLNDAERQFRKCNNFVEDQQTKKCIISPRSEPLSTATTDRDRDNFKNIGIQSEIVRQFDKAIQSNLTEDKETDDIVQFEQNQILEGFTKLNKKIENLEKNKEIEQQNNKNSLVKIEEKLMEVKQDLEAKSLRENDILNNVASKINTISSSNPENNSTADIEKMKEYLNKTVAQIQEQNIDQMTKVAEKIDLSCSEKLLNLRKDIESLGLLKSEQKVKLGKTKTDIFNLPMPIIKDINKREIIKRVEKKPVPLPLKIDDSESYSESSAATGDEISDDEIVSLKLKEISKPKTYIPTKSIIKSNTQQIQPVLARSDLRKEVIKMKKKCLKSLGITSSTTSLPSNSVPEIMSVLTQKRMSTKKKFPNFYATRNQIKKTIENISINKKNDLKIQNNINKDIKKSDNEGAIKSQEVEENDGYIEEYSSPRPVKNDKNVKSDRIMSSRESKTKINESTDEFSDHINSFQSKKEFNAKLEHLLSSPIRKLAEIHKKDDEYSTEVDGATSAERNNADNLIKPVPAPRKKIMFDLENFSNSMDSSSDDIDKIYNLNK